MFEPNGKDVMLVRVQAMLIGAALLAIEIRCLLVLRYLHSHHVVFHLLWAYPVLIWAPALAYWRAVLIIRRDSEVGPEVLAKAATYVSTMLLSSFMLLLLWDNILSDIYTKIGCSPK